MSLTKTTMTTEESTPQDAPLDTSILHLSIKNWTCSSARITNYDQTKTLYTVSTHFRRPHLVFFRGDDTETEFATVQCSGMICRFSMSINGHETTMKPKSLLHNKWTYSSPARSGKALTWMLGYHFKTTDFICLDENSLPLMKTAVNNLYLKEIGQVSFDNAAQDNTELQEELLVTGMALVYWMTVVAPSMGVAAVA